MLLVYVPSVVVCVFELALVHCIEWEHGHGEARSSCAVDCTHEDEP